jgi:hypothetical protein
MESISDLRKLLQEPRKSVDTWYGKNVMRQLSIYLTSLFIQHKWTPNQITLLSLAVAILSGVFFFFQSYVLGLFFINLWYLFDHCDGEVARYTKASSPTGFYFDTIVNFIIEPWIFFAIGLGLAEEGYNLAETLGALSAFGALMLMIVPVCEDAIILHLHKKRQPLADEKPASKEVTQDQKTMLRSFFSYWHKSILFPNFLLFLTASFLIFPLIGFPTHAILYAFLFYFAFSSSIIWSLQLFNKVQSRKLDSHPLV